MPLANLSQWAKRAKQLAEDIHGSRLEIVEGDGHMVHHLAPERLVAAVDAMNLESRSGRPAERIAA